MTSAPFTVYLTCGDCGQGNYATDGQGVYACTKGCGHGVTWADTLPEADEEIVLVDGLLAVTTTA